jgi:hypothetical protein
VTFDRLQLLHDLLLQVDQSVLLDPDTIQESHPGRVSPQQVEQLQILAADIQELRDAIMQAGPSPGLHIATLTRHRREAPRIWQAIAMLLPAVEMHASFELTATGRAALDSHQGA